MERTFESQSSGYGRMVLGVIRATKAKVSGFFTALRLPKIVVSMLTWALLISIGLMLAGLVAFAAFIYFMLTNSDQKSKAEQLADELREEGREEGRQEALAHWEYYMHLGDTNDRF